MITNEQIKSREENLKLQYESLRKDLDIVLTSLIPTQKNLMKTIMWTNVPILGIISSQGEALPIHEWLIIPFSFSCLAFLLILWALKGGREKTLGHMKSDEIHELEQDRFENIYGLLKLIEVTEIAIANNSEIVSKRGKHINGAVDFTLMSVISTVLYLAIAINVIL